VLHKGRQLAVVTDQLEFVQGAERKHCHQSWLHDLASFLDNHGEGLRCSQRLQPARGPHHGCADDVSRFERGSVGLCAPAARILDLGLRLEPNTVQHAPHVPDEDSSSPPTRCQGHVPGPVAGEACRDILFRAGVRIVASRLVIVRGQC
jgi:hypothetical protein